MKTGIEFITEERQEQIEKHGYTILKDSKVYKEDFQDDLCWAAAAYVLPDQLKTNWQKEHIEHRSNLFPWIKFYWKPSPENRIKELAKAGALIAAEIDRLQKLKHELTINVGTGIPEQE